MSRVPGDRSARSRTRPGRVSRTTPEVDIPHPQRGRGSVVGTDVDIAPDRLAPAGGGHPTTTGPDGFQRLSQPLGKGDIAFQDILEGVDQAAPGSLGGLHLSRFGFLTGAFQRRIPAQPLRDQSPDAVQAGIDTGIHGLPGSFRAPRCHPCGQPSEDVPHHRPDIHTHRVPTPLCPLNRLVRRCRRYPRHPERGEEILHTVTCRTSGPRY